ncbi:MAG: hypothetical protein KDE33_16495 [Bacteroidetes bacterium]|nr:hypothetical protein [Bacteroidota bacterium]
MKVQETVIWQCEKLLRDIINQIPMSDKKPFLETAKVYLKFSSTRDWKTLCSLLDLLNDTELAKENFEKYGISGPTKYDSQGEKHLRLYGILNTIYLQKSAIEEFIRLANHPDNAIFFKELRGLKLLELRNIVGAHTIDYLENGNKNPHQIQRTSIDQKSIRTLDSNNNFKLYNLNELLDEYNKTASRIFFLATEKFVMTVFKNGGNKRSVYLKRTSYIKEVLDGNIVLAISEDQDPIIVKIT